MRIYIKRIGISNALGQQFAFCSMTILAWSRLAPHRAKYRYEYTYRIRSVRYTAGLNITTLSDQQVLQPSFREIIGMKKIRIKFCDDNLFDHKFLITTFFDDKLFDDRANLSGRPLKIRQTFFSPFISISKKKY